MLSNYNITYLLLIATVIAVPFLIYSTRKLNAWGFSDTRETILRYWIYFLIFIFTWRAIMGTWLILSDGELYGIGKFYPIRIAYPNYEVLFGLLYLLICIGILVYLPRISRLVFEGAFKYLRIWLFASVVLLAFGGIHGGLTSGNIGISNSETHLFDAKITDSISETFITHTDRIKKEITPHYQAPHSMSHPASAVAYWQLFRNNTNAFFFSVINAVLFALAFPLIYWALRRRFDDLLALQCTLVCLFIPSFLIYGRSDDAVYYAMAAGMMVLTYVAIHENRYLYSVGAGVALALGLEYSYAALIMYPAMLSFNADIRLGQLWEYILKIIPHAIILAGVTTVLVISVSAISQFHLMEGFQASVQHNASSNIVALLEKGNYTRVLNDRIMAISDFLIFGGPIFLYLLVSWIKNRNFTVSQWPLKNLALFVLLTVLVINSNGPGEVSRPWGAIFLLIALCWITDLFKRESVENRWWIIRVQFCWALLLQIPLHFVW